MISYDKNHNYQHILELLEDGFIRADINGVITMVNRNLAEMFGYASPDEMIGVPMIDLYANPDDRKEVIESLRSEGKLINCELELRKKNKQTFWSISNIKFIYDDHGNVIGTEGVIRDITKRKEDEEILKTVSHDVQERMKELNLLYQATQVITQGGDLEKIISSVVEAIPPAWHYPEITTASIVYDGRTYVSEGFKKSQWVQCADIRVKGKKRGQIEVYYTKEMDELDDGPFMKEERDLINTLAHYVGLAAEDIEMKRELDASFQQLQAHEQQLVALNQQLRASNQQLSAGEQQLRSFNQQLSANEQELRAANQQLRATERRFKDTIHSISDGFFILETEELIVKFFNPAAENMLGRKAEEVLDQPLFDAFPEAKGSIFETNYLKALKEQITLSFETYFGEQPYENWYNVSVYPGDDRISVFFQVISERKFYEQHIEHLNRVLYASRDINKLIREEKDPKQLIQRSCNILVTGRGFMNAWVALFDENKQVTDIIQSGVGRSFDIMKKRMVEGELTRCAKRTLKSKDVVVIENIEKTCKDCPLIEEYKGRAAMSVRLSYEGKIYGLMTVSIPKAFTTKRDKLLVHSVADDLAMALNNIEIEGQRQRLLQSVNAINQPVALISKDYRYLSVNHAYERLFKLNTEHIIGRKISELIDEKVFNDVIKPQMEKALKGKKVNYELKLELNGEPRWMVMEYLPYYDVNKKITGVISSGTNITKRKQYEEKLQSVNQQLRAGEQQLEAANQQLRANNHQLTASEAQLKISDKRYRRAEAMAHIGNWEYDIQTERFWGSEEAKKIYGFDLNAPGFTSDEVEKCIPERDRVHQALIDLIERDKPYDLEFEIITHNNNEKKIIHSIAEMEKNPKGEPMKITGVILDITEKKRAEEEIRTRDMHLRSLVENPIGYLIYRTRLNRETGQIEVVQVSPSFTKVLGLPKQDRDNFNNWFAHVHPEDLPKLMKASENGMSPPFKLNVEIRYEHPTEGLKWLDLRARGIPYADDPNLIEYANGIILDITEQKKALEQLRESQEQLKNIVENSTNLFYAHDTNHKLTFVSPQVREYLACEPEEAKTRWTEFATDNPINEIGFNYTQRAIKTGERQPTYELELQGKDGRKIMVEVREAPVVVDGKVTGIVGSLADISERKIAEDAIKNISRRLRISTESAKIGTWEMDLKTNTLVWDDRMFELYGIDQEDFGGAYEAWKKGVHPDDIERSHTEVQDAIEGKKDFHTQFRVVWPDGRIRYIEAHAIVTRDEDNKPEKMIGVNWDITKQKQIELDLIAAKEKAEESDKLKSAFLANMSHEIRTPMNGIMGFSALLQRPGLSEETRDKYIHIIQKSGERMLSTINDLIEISKIETGQEELHLQDAQPDVLLKNLYEFFKRSAEDKGLDLIFGSDPVLKNKAISIDIGKFNSIVTNLVRNAIKYTQSGFIKLEGNKQEDQLIIEVKDSGQGIPKERQKAIFDRFVQADIKDSQAMEGSGLGLSIVKAYVEMMNGTISLKSEPGKGSCFTVSLPVDWAKELPTSDQDDAEEIGDLKLKKILIAEDDDVSYQHLAISLEKYAGSILHAVNGQEAVTLAKQHPDIDLILMDIKMPKMDGYEATQTIREFNQDVRIICQTAYAMPEDREKSMNAGCNEHLTKPLDISKLLKILSE